MEPREETTVNENGTVKKRRRSVKGIVFMAIGSVFVIGALALVGYNVWDSSRAGAAAEEALVVVNGAIEAPMEEPPGGGEEFVPDYKLDPEKEMPKTTVDGWDYIGKLSVPSIKLDLPVLGAWSYPGLRKAPCRYAGSAYLDNMIIAAHNYARHFGPLRNVPVGTEIIFTDMDANEFVYEVSEITIIQPTAIEEMKSGDWDLSLFTCTRGGAARVTVRCNRVSDLPMLPEVVPDEEGGE